MAIARIRVYVGNSGAKATKCVPVLLVIQDECELSTSETIQSLYRLDGEIVLWMILIGSHLFATPTSETSSSTQSATSTKMQMM